MHTFCCCCCCSIFTTNPTSLLHFNVAKWKNDLFKGTLLLSEISFFSFIFVRFCFLLFISCCSFLLLHIPFVIISIFVRSHFGLPLKNIAKEVSMWFDANVCTVFGWVKEMWNIEWEWYGMPRKYWYYYYSLDASSESFSIVVLLYTFTYSWISLLELFTYQRWRYILNFLSIVTHTKNTLTVFSNFYTNANSGTITHTHIRQIKTVI